MATPAVARTAAGAFETDLFGLEVEMTRITANIILLMMAGTWSWLSLQEGFLLPVSEQFVWLAVALASGEGVGFLAQKYKVPKNAKNDQD